MNFPAQSPVIYDIGIDIGGTFTDVVVVGTDGTVEVTKGLSTSRDQSQGAVAATMKLDLPMEKVRSIIHGTTVATNAILERRGARLALVTTRGFRDVLELQRQERSNIWDLYIRKTVPLVPRERRVEINERMSAEGEVITPICADALDHLVEKLSQIQAEAVAISFINAFANPENEQIVEEHLRRALPEVFVMRSSSVAPHFREYERTSTTAISAYVGPKLSRYLDRFEGRFTKTGFSGRIFVMGSNGGVLPIARTSAHSGTTCLSGPAGGVLATQRLAREKGTQNLISFDMGGTSTDVCVIADGRAMVSTAFQIDGLPITLPMFAIETVSAGGGSIASVDAGGLLQVGPESAGSDPGPACYGRGGKRPTVTDALCLLGLIRPESFFGGSMTLDLNAAEAAFAPLAEALDSTADATAVMTLKIANARMANAVRLVTVREGHDPRGFALVAFGGAGGLHACAVAEDLGIDHVIIPRFPGAFSALGLLSANIRRDFLRSLPARLSTLAPEHLHAALKELHQAAEEEMESMASRRPITWAFHADLRYHGQASELLVPVPREARDLREELAQAFHAQHHAKFGYDERDAEIEIINLRLTGWVEVADNRLPSAPRRSESTLSLERQPTRLPGSPEVAFAHRDVLCAGDVIDGPAVISETTGTTFVAEGWQLSVDAQGHLDIHKVLQKM